MSWTTSPGIRRGSVKTITDAMISEGMATSSRLKKYRLNTSAPSPPRLPFQPGRHQPATVVVAHVRGVVPERAVPDSDVDLGGHLYVVLLLGQVALDVVNDLPPLGHVQGPPLAHEHVGHHGIVDVTLVLQLLGIILAEEEVVRLQEPRLGPEGHRLELAIDAAGDVGPVL